jgi:hypothetical protein
MSDLYSSFYQALEPKRFVKDSAPNPLHLEMGLALENMLEEGIKDRLALTGGGRPGELVEPEHGIIYSPDLLIFNGETRLGEVKLTFMSSREVPREVINYNGFPPKFEKYFTQMKMYCRCLETSHARLYVFFVNGDYTWRKKGEPAESSGPQLLAWDIEFTKREIEEEWQVVTSHARHVGLLK